jgi:ketosteroid isomerase-like protein
MGPNEAILRELYERYGGGDVEHLFTKLSDDVVWKSAGNPQILSTAGVRRGTAALRDHLATLRAEWEIQKHDVLEIIAQSDTRFALRIGVAAVHNRTKGRVELEKVDLVSMKDGRVAAYEEIFDTAMLERAAGHGPSER